MERKGHNRGNKKNDTKFDYEAWYKQVYHIASNGLDSKKLETIYAK